MKARLKTKYNFSSSLIFLWLLSTVYVRSELLEHDFTSINHNTSSERGVPLSNKKVIPVDLTVGQLHQGHMGSFEDSIQ